MNVNSGLMSECEHGKPFKEPEPPARKRTLGTEYGKYVLNTVADFTRSA